ncbi:MAG TPA: TetR/AcrR family transcriptional regulator [Solirubrobacteraceae bacterium]|nr:TetR/AcrR family transcriptional regulator [Solirubrobacteraceae bacterium]
MPPQPYHHGNLRAALLQQAWRTVEERGASALSLRELAREIGVSHAAPRRHFPDRQALLDALGEDGFAALQADLQRAVHEAGSEFGARLHGLAQAYIAFATRHPALLELMFAGKHRPGADRLREAADRAFATALAVIAEAQRSGELAAGDTGRVAIVAFATLQGLATMANGGLIESAPVEAVVTDAIDQLLDGLRPRALQASGARAGGGSGS